MKRQPLSEEERSRLHHQLVQLGDLIGSDDEWGARRREYNREYRKIMKILYPEMFKKRTNQLDIVFD